MAVPEEAAKAMLSALAHHTSLGLEACRTGLTAAMPYILPAAIGTIDRACDRADEMDADLDKALNELNDAVEEAVALRAQIAALTEENEAMRAALMDLAEASEGDDLLGYVHGTARAALQSGSEQ